MSLPENAKMVLAIVRKELRETRLFAALALGLYLIYVSKLTGQWGRVLTHLLGWVPGMNGEPPYIPFVQDNFLTILSFIGVALAITLGFRQSAWEPSQGTAQYLLHLPLARRTIFLTKLTTGIGLLLVCTLLPILIYATWAALPGTHPSPFEWSMTAPAFQLWSLIPLAYLGAFASGIRAARWFGSRLLPLLAVAIPFVFSFEVPSWWLIGFPLLLLVAAVLVSDILWEAETRDY
jgi:ABC-type transport system involved in multi-copper enzyme maturation permease subunit